MQFDNLIQAKQFIRLWLYGKTQSHFVLHDLKIDLAGLSLKRIKQYPLFLPVRCHGTQGLHYDLFTCNFILKQWSDPFCIIEIGYMKDTKKIYLKLQLPNLD